MEHLQLTDASDKCERTGIGLTDVLNSVLFYIHDARDISYLCMASNGVRSSCLAYLVNNSRAGRSLIHNAVQRCAYDLQHPKRILPRKVAVAEQSVACRAAISWIMNVCDHGSVGTEHSCQCLRHIRSVLASIAPATPELIAEVLQVLSASDHMHAQEQQAS